MKHKYAIEGLDCPNCAAKLEVMMREIAGVESAKINFLTQKLTVESELDAGALLQPLQDTARRLAAGSRKRPDRKHGIAVLRSFQIAVGNEQLFPSVLGREKGKPPAVSAQYALGKSAAVGKRVAAVKVLHHKSFVTQTGKGFFHGLSFEYRIDFGTFQKLPERKGIKPGILYL